MSNNFRLRAEDAEDLAIIAAMLQDARTMPREMVFNRENNTFMVAVTRYQRECANDLEGYSDLCSSPAVLIIHGVNVVRQRGIGEVKQDGELRLLTIATEPGTSCLFAIDLIFEGDIEVQLCSDKLDCHMEDFGEPEPVDDETRQYLADMPKNIDKLTQHL